MNKIAQYFIVPLLVSITAFAVIPSSQKVFAATNFNITTVRGVINGPDGKPFKLAKVSVVCGTQTKNTITSGTGRYIAVFTNNGCTDGSVAAVTADKDGVKGSGSGTVSTQRDGKVVDVNFSAINFAINAVGVPEFGWTTGALAVVFSAGVFFLLRKRKLAYLPIQKNT